MLLAESLRHQGSFAHRHLEKFVSLVPDSDRRCRVSLHNEVRLERQAQLPQVRQPVRERVKRYEAMRLAQRAEAQRCDAMSELHFVWVGAQFEAQHYCGRSAAACGER